MSVVVSIFVSFMESGAIDRSLAVPVEQFTTVLDSVFLEN